jgi:DHA3 family macrolide efflux protein-like MFS transporter
MNWKKTFFFIWTGQAFSLVGSSLVGFALVWWMTQTTGSAAVLTTAALVSALPGVFLGPFIGALVDRWNRRLVMMAADGMTALVTLGIVFLFFTGQVQIWHLYVLNFIRSIGGLFHWTAMQTSTSLMVPKDQLTRIAGLNQTLQGALSIATPPLGALLLGLLPMHWILSIDVSTAILAILPLSFVRIPQPEQAERAQAVTPRVLVRDVRAGLRYVWSWPGMVLLLGMAVLINFLLNPAGTLMPLLVTRHFNGGVWHLGAVESAWSVGMIAGGLLLGVWGGFKRKIVTSLTGLVALGLGALLIGLAPGWAFGLAIAGQVVLGMMNPLVNGPLFAILQDRIAPEMQGRVFTLVGSLAGLMAPLGLAIAGPVAERLGIQVWFWIGGICCILMGAGSFLIPAIMQLEDSSGRPEGPAVQASQVIDSPVD